MAKTTGTSEETVEVVFVNHYRDRAAKEDYVPGTRASFPADVARRLVRTSTAKYATKDDASAAGDPKGPTPRTS